MGSYRSRILLAVYFVLIGAAIPSERRAASAGRVSSSPREEQSGSHEKRADQLWQSSPVFLSHTHIDPGTDPHVTSEVRSGAVEESVNALVRAGVTTAVFNLTIDDGDWTSATEGYTNLPQHVGHWDKRFDNRLKAVEKLKQVVIVHHMSDIPVSPQAVRQFRRERKIALVIASEGSNQINFPGAGAPQSIGDSIATLRDRGWLSAALIHQPCDVEKGHRLLRPDGGDWNDNGRYVAHAFNSHLILIDLPHYPFGKCPCECRVPACPPPVKPMRRALIDIAREASRPVMISHENPAGLVQAQSDDVSAVVASGKCTGVIGVHSASNYINLPPRGNPPTNVDAYARAIDAGRTSLNQLKFDDGRPVDGSRHLALGLDWFWQKDLRLDGWAGRADGDELYRLVQILLSPPYNYSDEDVRNILGMNMVRIMSASLNEQTDKYLTTCK